MSDTLGDRLSTVPLVNRKAELRRGEPRLPKRNPQAGGALLDAMHAAHLEPKAMADTCGISDSLCRRALASVDDIGFHRLWELDDLFWEGLLIAVAQRRRVARVRITLDFDRTGTR